MLNEKPNKAIPGVPTIGYKTPWHSNNRQSHLRIAIIMRCQVIVTMLALSCLSCNSISAQHNKSAATYSSWYHFNSATKEYQCYQHVTCTEQGAVIPTGHCMTYDESSKSLSYVLCHFLHDNLTDDLEGIKLPNKISELNEYMCGPLNRKGSVCSECIDGFGPSLASLGYECSNCTGTWHGLPLYFLLEFGPITVFFVVIFAFQFSFTSAPMTGFIMYSQIVLFEIVLSNSHLIRATLADGGLSQTLVQVIATFYGVWNLDFLWYIVPPFCVSRKLKLIDLLFIRHMCAFYPFFLIVATWICIELHGQNFKPLVWLWSPFHKCMVRIRRSLDVKTDIVDVFASFYLLSCSKLVYQAITVMTCHHISITSTGSNTIESVVSVTEDLSVHCYSTKHWAFFVVSLFVIILFVLLPVLVLMLYPTKFCRQCLTKCRMDGRPRTILFTFVEKFHSSYRDGLDGEWDMRSFAGIHFLLRFFCFVGWRIFLVFKITNRGSLFKILGLAAAFALVAYLKPYKKTYMNVMDVLMLSYTALLYLIDIETSDYKQSVSILVYLFLPIAVFVIAVSVQLIAAIHHKTRDSKLWRCYKRGQIIVTNTNSHQRLNPPIAVVQHTSYGSTSNCTIGM